MKSRKEWVRPKVGNDSVCIFFVWQDEMKMRCCQCIFPGVSRIYSPRRSFHLRYRCISLYPPSLLNDILGGRDRSSLEMHLEAEIEWTERCSWRPWSIELRAALGGRDRASLEMHLEAEIEGTERCTWRPWSIEFGDALGGQGGVNSEIHFEAVFERVWTCNWRPRLSELKDPLWGCDGASLVMHFQDMIARDWRSTWRQSIWREAGRQLILYSLVNL